MATQTEAIRQILLKWKTDTSSINKTIADNQKVQNSIAGVAQKNIVAETNFQKAVKESTRVSEEFAAARADATRRGDVDKIADEWTRVYKETKNAETAFAAVEARLKAIGATSGEIDQVANSIANVQAGGGSSAGSALKGAGRAIFNAPAVGASTPIARGLIAVGDIADKTGASLAQLGIAGGLAGVAIVGVGLALAEFTKGIEASKKTLASALSAQDVYYTALRDNTTQQVRDEIDALTKTQAVRGQQRLETQQAIDNAFAQAQATFGDATARALDAAGKLPTAQLRETLTALDEEFNANELSIGRLTQGVNANAFAANDATAAEKALKDARLAAVPIFASAVQEEIRAQGLTSEERKKAIDAIYLEGAVLKQFGQANIDNAEIVDYVNGRIDELNRNGIILGAITESIADKEAKLTAIRQAQTDNVTNYLDALKQEGDAQDALTKVTKEYTDASQKAGQALQAIQDGLIDKEAEINQKAADAQTKEDTKTAKEREKALKDHNKRLLDIEQDRFRAIGNRDQVALEAANQARDKENTAYQDRLDELQTALDDQAKIIEQARRDEQQKAQDAARKSISDLKEKWATEERDRQTAIAVARNTLHNAQVAAQLTQDSVYAAEQQAAARAAQVSIEASYQTGVSIGQALIAGVNTGAFTGAAYQTKPTQFPVAQNTNQPFIPPAAYYGSQARAGGSSGSGGINITVNGSSKTEIMNAVWNELDSALT